MEISNVGITEMSKDDMQGFTIYINNKRFRPCYFYVFDEETGETDVIEFLKHYCKDRDISDPKVCKQIVFELADKYCPNKDVFPKHLRVGEKRFKFYQLGFRAYFHFKLKDLKELTI